MAPVDLNRKTAGVVLPPSVSNEIWSKAAEQSIIMQVSGQMSVPGNGMTIPLISGNAQANWVAESEEKPVSRPTLGSKTVTPYKLAVIVPFSNELRRDATALYNTVVGSLPGALAEKFDDAVLFGPAPGSGFDTLAAAPTTELDPADSYGSLISALSATTGADGGVSAWVMSPAGEIALLGAVDGNGRPLFTANANSGGSVGTVLGRPVYVSKHAGEAGTPNTLGFAGDWANDSKYGVVSGIQIKISEEATINDGGTQINLWQRNLSAALCEMEVAFVHKGATKFTRMTD